MDWDGIGTAALFLGSGAIGVAIIALRAYKAKLSSKLEWERLRRSDPASDEALDHVRDLETQVRRLTERLEFTEGLLSSGQSPRSVSDRVE